MFSRRKRLATRELPKKRARDDAVGGPRMTDDKSLRRQLIELLEGRGAHAGFEDAIEGLPPELRGARVRDLPFTPWRLLEHMRIAQWDILEFSRNAGHVSPQWPQGYWPSADAPEDDQAWERSAASFRRDLEAMQELVGNPATDLFARIPHGTGQNILREAMLVADHNSYHLGQFILLRRLLGAWRNE